MTLKGKLALTYIIVLILFLILVDFSVPRETAMFENQVLEYLAEVFVIVLVFGPAMFSVNILIDEI